MVQLVELGILLLIVIFSLVFVIGDGLSGDQLCGLYKNYSPNGARLSCTCDVTFNKSNNTNWQCQFLKMEELQSVSLRALELHGFILNEDVDWLPINEKMYEMNQCMDKLQKLLQHMHDNACIVWCKSNACQTDLMHALYMDRFLMLLKLLLGHLPVWKTSDGCFVTF